MIHTDKIVYIPTIVVKTSSDSKNYVRDNFTIEMISVLVLL